ncbi:MAG: hypothetical protein LBE83_09800 [Propionibacteriaceae bacterium]|jgi:hypothetical protein|nr:hypothetical protein [Propionibacteriaceae bacterium]
MNRAAQVAREDVLAFINAATASTGQREFASTAAAQTLSVDFLHEYVLGNYRDLYAATLALDVNDHNAALIMANLLGVPHDNPARREVEGRLIAARLATMPPQRVYRLFTRLQKAGVNNSRARAIIRNWVYARPAIALDAIKYRRGLTAAARHAHLRLPDEIGMVLFDWKRPNRYTTPLLETWRRAHYDRSAITDLPYTVAEGFAARRGLKRETLLTKVQLTKAERLRLAGAAKRAGVTLETDLGTQPLTRLATYVLSLERSERGKRLEELTTALRASANRAAGVHRGTWGRVVTVGDDSYSSYGSGTKRRRPLAVALAVHYLAEALASEHHGLWLSHQGDPLLVHPQGATPLGRRLLDGLALAPDRLLIVSDGWDNDPPGGASEVLRVWRQRLDPQQNTKIVHLNPVYDPDTYLVRPLAPHLSGVPSVGIRDGQDAVTLVEIARFVTGEASFDDLVVYLDSQVARALGRAMEQEEL